MRRYSNYHTHTTFCDGNNTPEEMVLAAIEAGCPSLGFSGHSYTPFDPGYCMMPEDLPAYRDEILRLREKYRNKIRILLGLELDYFSEKPKEDFDYIIGSVHYVKKNGEYLSVDHSMDTQIRQVEEYYGGDFYAFAEDYYTLVADVKRKTGCDIVGHFDLVTKFHETKPLFDEKNPRYRTAAERALKVLLDQGALLEINTGAISRGYRTTPYPAAFLLEEMGRRGAKAVLSADCHSTGGICCAFEKAAELAERCGVKLTEPDRLA